MTKAKVAGIVIALGLILILGLAGCKTVQERTAAPVVVQEEPQTCEVRFLNFLGRSFPVLMMRIDGPGHMAFMLESENPAMTQKQCDRYLERAEDPKFKAYTLSGVPCGEYRITAPTLGISAVHRICDCKDNKYNVAFYLLPEQDAGLGERT